MNSVNHGQLDAIPRLKLFNCVHAECGARFTKEWRLKEHETVHTGAPPPLFPHQRPLQCPQPGCGRRFSRRSHLSRHNLSHSGAKQFGCTQSGCPSSFFSVGKLKRHVLYAHGNKDTYFKCRHPECHLMFRKRRMYKMHLKEHGVSPNFRCVKEGCGAEFETRVARRAHERTHAGYSCPVIGCQVVERTWGRIRKHAQTHPASYACSRCQASFGRREALRRHRRRHALQKPVLLCPREGCQSYFSTTFNLQHHIRKTHLQLLKHRCAYPACERAFAMRRCVSRKNRRAVWLLTGGFCCPLQESLNRHMVHHDPHGAGLKKRWRSSKKWQKRLKGGQQRPLVEEDLRRLFALRLRFPRRAKVEADLSGLFNERKIPRLVSPEVNLQQLFSLKAPGNQAPPAKV
ncbi:P43 5S RNA-binding protein-like isoform X2 [Anguilla anguilla]|uniref:P43 5S RNA-binding protein-like isoform X2 n=1 Tax=Anguilla anguilla TaxID=7936 RepID=UPI0015ABCF28|nr:P43 5S RNA-binding protein-like isoform X2 [Anguilla anguilla]